MCQSKQNEALPARSPKSPWRFFKQPVKPKLSRKIIAGARVNLNRYWNKFEEVTSLQRSPSSLIFATPHTRLSLTSLADATVDNEINDNLINELMETGNLLP